MGKNCSKSFSDSSSNSSDIEEEVTKQINMLKPFDMEPRNAIPQKHFVSEKENTVKKKLIQHHKIELVTSISANVGMSENQWRHYLKVYAYWFD